MVADQIVGQLHEVEQLAAAITRSCRAARGDARARAPARVWPTVMVGLSDDPGSWNTIWMRRRVGMSRFAFSSAPSKRMRPEVGCTNPDDRPRQRRLAAPRLADDAERRTTVDAEIEPIDRAEDLAARAAEPGSGPRRLLEIDVEVFDFEERRHFAAVVSCVENLGVDAGGPLMLVEGEEPTGHGPQSSPRTGNGAANRQPIGNSPDRAARHRSSRAGVGVRRGSGRVAGGARVYGCFGVANSCDAVPSSTICPAYITATRCAI